MKITILCSDPKHPVNPYLQQWMDRCSEKHTVELVRSQAELSSGDFLFLVSCSEILHKAQREKYRFALVLHASDLPLGRGWSPHVWAIVKGADHITLTLLEAEDQVDSGRIWLQRRIPIPDTALWDEVNALLFEAEIDLMTEAIEHYERIDPKPQPEDVEPSYYPKRTPQDSRLDTNKSIADQFDLLRMCDPERYPAWFEFRGQKYIITLKKAEND